MRKLAVMVMSFVAAVMLGGAAVLTAVMPARAADVTGIEAVEAMFETENTAAFSTFGGRNNVVVTQADNTPVTEVSPGAADATHNQTTTITYKNPIYIGDNSDEVPFFSYSVYGQDGTERDFDALIVTLTDAEDETNQVSVLVGFWSPSYIEGDYSLVYAKGTGQSYKGYHWSDVDEKSMKAPVEQGTMLYKKAEASVQDTWSLYYDNETKRVLVDGGWASYADRNGSYQNDSGATLTTVRDLTDTATSGADSTAYTAGMETAYLSVTTVRGWYAYNGIGTSTIYSGAFRDGSGTGHTLSDKGARYMIRSIDGLNFGLTNGTMADSETVYFAESFSGRGAAEIPVLNRYTVLGGIAEDKTYTEGTYITVENESSEPVDVQGLSLDGKWTDGCGFAGENGVYTVNYYADSAHETLVESITVTLYRPAFDRAEEIVAPNVFEGDGSTFGWEIFRVGNSSLYSGVTVSTAAAGPVTYTKDINISDNTENDVLLQFIAIPNEVGVFDFTSITFKFIDKSNQDNYFTVKLGEGASGNVGSLTAGGSNQDLYGLKYIRNNDEYGEGLYGTGIPQNLAGQGNGSFQYTTICLYYDKEDNALYVSPAHNYKTQAAEEKQLVRNFGDTSLKLNEKGDTVSQAAWNGFTGDTVTLEITVNTVAEGKTAKYGVLTVDGERLTKRLEAEFLFDGIVDYEYALPTPTYVSGLTGAETNFGSVASGVRVLYEGKEVDVLGGVFTPQSAGEYTVQYAVEEGGTTYMAEFALTVFTQNQAPAVEFDISGGVGEGDVIYLGSGIQGSVSAATALHHDGSACEVTVQIFKGKEVVKTFENGEFSYDFNEVGDYTLVFTAVDKVGRESVREIPFAVSRTSIEIADPDDEQTLLDRSDKIVFSASDIKVNDVRIEGGRTITTPQKDFASLKVSISYSYNDGEFTKWTQDSDLSALGDYKIKYTVSYTLKGDEETYGSEYVRTVKVVDNTAPALDEAEQPVGNVQADASQSTDSALYYKALTDEAISVLQLGATDARGDGTVDLSGEVKVKLTDADGKVTDVVFKAGKFTFTPEKAGTYYVTFTVSDGVLKDTLVYVFEVKNVWLNASFESDTLADAVFGTAYELPVPVLTDFNGGAVTGAQITVEIIPESGTSFTVENYTFTPDQTGTFTVRYTITGGGESVVKEFALTVKDTTAPVIVFDGEVPKSAEAGDTVVLPAVKITDDRDSVLGYRIWLEFEGERTELFDLSFKAEKVGTYKIIVETSDTAGNPAEISAEITVTERSESGGGCSGTLFAGAGMAGAAVAMAAALLLKKKKKANR